MMTRARSARRAGPSHRLFAFVLLAVVAGAALVWRPTAALAQATTRPADAAATTAPTTGEAAAEEESSEPYVMPPAVHDNSIEREFWIRYVGVPVVTMLAVIAVGVFIIVRLRRSRPATTTPNDPTPPPAA